MYFSCLLYNYSAIIMPKKSNVPRTYICVYIYSLLGTEIVSLPLSCIYDQKYLILMKCFSLEYNLSSAFLVAPNIIWLDFSPSSGFMGNNNILIMYALCDGIPWGGTDGLFLPFLLILNLITSCYCHMFALYDLMYFSDNTSRVGVSNALILYISAL